MTAQVFLQQLATIVSPADILHDAESLANYGRDWTRLHTPAPLAVCFPRSTEQVSNVLRLASEHGVAVVPSGGRTGLAGGAVAADHELVLSLEKMNHIGAVCTSSRTIHVEAGAITDAVQAACEPLGLQWPVDFASSGSSHIGGNLATNAGGIRVIKYGMARRWVLGVKAVLMDGTILDMTTPLEKNNTGYDLTQLLIGSEGTLAVITEATLKLAPIPAATQVALFSVGSMESASDLLAFANTTAGARLMACEVMSRACLDVMQKHSGAFFPLEGNADYAVLIEVDGRDDTDAENCLTQIAERAFENETVLHAVIAQSAKDKAALWRWREGIGEALAKDGLLHKNDIAVPVMDIPAFTEALLTLAEKHRLTPFVFGHLGDGNLHVNTMKDAGASLDEFQKAMKAWNAELFVLLHDFRGSISAEHGIGLLKRDALKHTRCAAEIALFRQIKAAFDPRGLLNPGKVIVS